MPTLSYVDPFLPLPSNTVNIFYSDHTPNAVGIGLDETYAVDASKVTRLLQMPWGLRVPFIKGLLGFPYLDTAVTTGGAAVTPAGKSYRVVRRLPPLAYPFVNTSNENYLFATSVTKTEGIGPRGKSADGIPQYVWARLTVNFTSPLYDVWPDAAGVPNSQTDDGKGGFWFDEGYALGMNGSGGTRYITRFFKPAGRVRRIPQGLMSFVNGPPNQPGDPTPEPVPQHVACVDVSYIWHQVPEEAYPKAAVQNALGTLNQNAGAGILNRNAVIGKDFDGLPTGTLRLDSVDLKRGRSPFGRRIYETVEYKCHAEFNIRPDGSVATLNALPIVVKAGPNAGLLDYIDISSNGLPAGTKLFRFSDFRQLFVPDGA